MRQTFLPFSPPLIGDEEIAEVLDTLRSDWITTGPKMKRFEQDPPTGSGQGSQSSSRWSARGRR